MDQALVLQTIVLMMVSYLAGSIPVGVIVARFAHGTDPRTVGSGRTGGTNAAMSSASSSMREFEITHGLLTRSEGRAKGLDVSGKLAAIAFGARTAVGQNCPAVGAERDEHPLIENRLRIDRIHAAERL